MLLYRGIQNTLPKQLSIFINRKVELGGSSAHDGGTARAVVVA